MWRWLLFFALIRLPAEAQVIWSADHENGRFDPWIAAGAQPNTSKEVTTQYAHTGKYSMALSVHDAPADKSTGVRMKVDGSQWTTPDDPKNLPDEAYYSAWYYIPQHIHGVNNIFQFKQSRALERGGQTAERAQAISLSDMVPKLHSWTSTGKVPGSTTTLDTSPVPVPSGRWFHLECLQRWSTEPDGKIICWVDGKEILRAENVRTQYSNIKWHSYPRKWKVNNYAIRGGQDPATHTIYIDDAKIALSRTWDDYIGDLDCNGDGALDVLDANCARIDSLDVTLDTANLLLGDVDGDGHVGFADFSILAENFGNAAEYTDGDFDKSGIVGLDDFVIFRNCFARSSLSAATVPEPSTWLLITPGVMGLMSRRGYCGYGVCSSSGD